MKEPSFESFLGFEKLKEGKGDEPSQFADYPEHVLKTLKVFYDVWKIPKMAIPSKRQPSKFKQWVADLETVADLCGSTERFEKALRLAVVVYDGYSLEYRFKVDTPLKLKNLLITQLASMDRMKERETPKVETRTKTEDEKTESLKRMSDLRNRLKKEDN